jgi:hypothetical protein
MRKDNYFVKSIGQFYYYVVAKKVDLSPIAIPGGRPQIVRLRVVKFEVDGSVCCSCEFFERIGIVCRQILAIVHEVDESMIDVRWRAALGFFLGKNMYARVTSVIMQALGSSLKMSKLASQVWRPAILRTAMGRMSHFSLHLSREVLNDDLSPRSSIFFISLHGRGVMSRT